MKKNSILYFLFFIIVSSSCNHKEESNQEFNTIYYCDAELRTADNIFFVSTLDTNIIFKHGNMQSADFSLSGNYSVKVNKKKAYAMTIEIAIEKDENYSISVWRYGNKNLGQIVAENSDFWYGEKQAAEDDSLGWHKITLNFTIPPNNKSKTMKVYLWNNNEKSVYFDNFSIKKKPPRVYPYFEETALNIFIEDAEMQKLQEKRLKAFENRILTSDDDSYVKGIVFYKDNQIKSKIRLKGDWLDHLRGIKWSFRIKLNKKNSLFGLKTFSVQNPKARYFIDEWLLHKICEDEDILTTRYEFIPLRLNGKSLGLYVYEEHFEKQLVEAKNRREGVLIKFSEDQLWHSRIAKQEGNFPNDAASEILAFKSSKMLKNNVLYNNFLIAQNLLNQFKYSKSTASEIFDVEKLAKYYAMVDLSKGYHGMIWHNLRFYYNPILCKLEPVAYDNYCDAGVFKWFDRSIYGNFNAKNINKEKKSTFKSLYLFSDSTFVSYYIKYLEIYSSKEFVENLFQKYNNEIDRYEKMIQKEYTDYKFDYNFLRNNAKQIRKDLPRYKDNVKNNNYCENIRNSKPSQNKIYKAKYNSILPTFYLKAFFNNKDKSLKIVNYYPEDITILGTSIDKKIISAPFDNNLILNSFNKKNNDTTLIDISQDAKYLFFKLENIDEIFKVSINKWKFPDNYSPQKELVEKSNFGNQDYYYIENEKVIFNQEKYSIAENIVIPPNYKVFINEGTELNFTNNSLFLSYSTVYIKGKENNPVIIKSSDGSAMGFTILQAKEKSELNNVIFDNLNTLNFNGWLLTGAVNFYESEVEINNTTFSNNNCEDALNTVRSNFLVKNCFFKNIYGDAFDSDFCTGILTKTNFDKIGNDAIDFSGSVVEINNCKLSEIEDKGISGGEHSTLNVADCEISNCNIGIASKDNSDLTITDCQVIGAIYGLLAFQKKPEYSSATITTKNYIWKNVITNFLIEKKSTLNLNGKMIYGIEKNVAKKFY